MSVRDICRINVKKHPFSQKDAFLHLAKSCFLLYFYLFQNAGASIHLAYVPGVDTNGRVFNYIKGFRKEEILLISQNNIN